MISPLALTNAREKNPWSFLQSGNRFAENATGETGAPSQGACLARVLGSVQQWGYFTNRMFTGYL